MNRWNWWIYDAFKNITQNNYYAFNTFFENKVAFVIKYTWDFFGSIASVISITYVIVKKPQWTIYLLHDICIFV